METKDLDCEVCGSSVTWRKLSCICFGYIVWVQGSGSARAVRNEPLAYCVNHLPEEEEHKQSEPDVSRFHCITVLSTPKVDERQL